MVQDIGDTLTRNEEAPGMAPGASNSSSSRAQRPKLSLKARNSRSFIALDGASYQEALSF